MWSTIIIQSTANKAKLDLALSNISSVGLEDVSIVKTDSNSAGSAEEFAVLAKKAKGDTVLLLEVEVAASIDQLNNVIAAMNQADGLGYFAIESGSNTIDLEDLPINRLPSFIASSAAMPIIGIALTKSDIASLASMEFESILELAAAALVKLAARGDAGLIGSVTLADASAVRNATGLTSMQRARALNILISEANIEDLFPNHPWGTHEGESAAAAYHSLAALLLRLGDTETASELLRAGDQLEDSPRSLALKGLIALDRGETLGAVANLVSSLQQYEIRKKNSDNVHFLSFAPKDIEKINTDLNAGLEALNNRDNEGAVSHFAEAIFNFDSFYTDFGIDACLAKRA